MRFLRVFKSQDHALTARQAVSCMNHHIVLVLKAHQSITHLAKSFKIHHWFVNLDIFRLTPFHADFVDYVECNIDGEDVPKLKKLLILCHFTQVHCSK